MKVRSLVAIALLTAVFLGVRASAATPDLFSYDDAGMHFRAPDGWLRLPVPVDTSSPGLDEKKLLAAYQFSAGKNDVRAITIVAEPFDGSLDGAESQYETDLRSGSSSDSTIVDHKARTTLANGMPAWFIRVTQGSDPFTTIRTYEYVVYDGSRRIIASYAGHAYNYGEDDAKKALSSLYVVVYPKNRS